MYRNENQELRVLVVEDDPLMFMAIEDLLLDAGYTVVGPVQSLEAAVDAAAKGDCCDVALLDVNLSGEAVDPVAQILEQHGIPFIFSTGYDCKGILERWPAALAVQKPWWSEELLGTLAVAASRSPARATMQISAELALKAAANIAAEILTLDTRANAAQSA